MPMAGFLLLFHHKYIRLAGYTSRANTANCYQFSVSMMLFNKAYSCNFYHVKEWNVCGVTGHFFYEINLSALLLLYVTYCRM